MKRIIIIFTGGTISMKTDEENNSAAVPSMNGEDILKLTPGIETIATIDLFNFAMLPGPHITPEKMLQLSNFIQHKISFEGYDGVVVTHGTDSLEETSYLVDLLYNGEKPIIFVGSMRNSSQLGWDGPSNLIDAVRTAASDDSKNRGVMVVMNGEIHSASQVTKTNTHTLDTFKSLDFGPIGSIDNNKVCFHFSYTKREYIGAKKINSNIDLIKCGCGMDDRLLKFCVDSKTSGIIIEGMGRGNIPPTMVPGIEYAINQGIPVILVSRCLMGKVLDDYGYEGAGRELTDKGVILGDNLPGQKARIKLMVALGFTSSLCEIKKIFEEGHY